MTANINNTSTIPSSQSESRDRWSQSEAILISQVLILLFSNINNIVVIIALTKKMTCGKMKTFTTLIVALSVSDIVLIESSIPTNFVTAKHGFIFGKIGCSIIYPLATMATNLSVLLLLCISIERYVAIAHPMFWKSRNFSTANILIGTILVSFITVIPYGVHLELVFDKPSQRFVCVETWNVSSNKIYTLFLFLIQYGIPLTIMLVLYSKAWFHLYKENKRTINVYCNNNHSPSPSQIKSEPRQRKLGHVNDNLLDISKLECSENLLKVQRKQGYQVSSNIMYARKRRSQTVNTFFMFLLVVIVFAVCSLPNQITWLYKVYFADSGQTISKVVEAVFYDIHFMNCVLNPLIYGGISKTMRQKIFNVFVSKGRTKTFTSDDHLHERVNLSKSSYQKNFKSDFRLSRYQPKEFGLVDDID